MAIRHSGLKKDKFYALVKFVRTELKLQIPKWTFEQIAVVYGCMGILESCHEIHECFKTKFIYESLQEKQFVDLSSHEALLAVFFESCKALKVKINTTDQVPFDAKLLKLYSDRLHQFCQEDLDLLKENSNATKKLKIECKPSSIKTPSKSTTPTNVKSESKKSQSTFNPLKSNKWTTCIRIKRDETKTIYDSKEYSQYLIWKERILSELTL